MLNTRLNSYCLLELEIEIESIWWLKIYLIKKKRSLAASPTFYAFGSYCLVETILKSNEKSIQEDEKHLLSVQKQNDGMVVSAQVTDFHTKSETKCLYQKRKQFI